jgi:hypothetical protein
LTKPRDDSKLVCEDGDKDEAEEEAGDGSPR